MDTSWRPQKYSIKFQGPNHQRDLWVFSYKPEAPDDPPHCLNRTLGGPQLRICSETSSREQTKLRPFQLSRKLSQSMTRLMMQPHLTNFHTVWKSKLLPYKWLFEDWFEVTTIPSLDKSSLKKQLVSYYGGYKNWTKCRLYHQRRCSCVPPLR